jgi:hypothetical protein
LVTGAASLAASAGGNVAADPPKPFPPIPSWRPAFHEPLDRIADRFVYYINGKRDFALFTYGTCAVLADDLSEAAAEAAAKAILDRIYRFHPDMNPTQMDDGNVLVRYNHPAANVVLRDFATAHWAEIDANHLRALTPDEVLITPLGPNKFDDFGKMALFGRCFMFMDAQSPAVVRLVRRNRQP